MTITLEIPKLSPQKAKRLPSRLFTENFAEWEKLRGHEIEEHDESFYNYYPRDVKDHIDRAARGFDTSEKARAVVRSGKCEVESWEILAASDEPWRVLSVIAIYFGWKFYPYVHMVADKRHAPKYEEKIKARIEHWLKRADITYEMLIQQPQSKLNREAWRGYVQHHINEAREIMEAAEFYKP